MGAPAFDTTFRVLPFEEIFAFSFNGNPAPYVARCTSLPPFACHGWLSVGALLFYRRFLPFTGISPLLKVSALLVLLLRRSLVFRLRGFAARLHRRVRVW